MADEQLKVELELTCPCGGKISICRTTKAIDKMPAGTPCVLHVEPRCAKFEALEVDEFLRYVRKSMEN